MKYFSIHQRFFSFVTCLLLAGLGAQAQDLESNYKFRFYHGEGFGNGQAALAVFVKSDKAGLSDRIPHSRPFAGRSRINLDFTVIGAPIPNNTVAVGFSGQLKMDDGKTYYLPVYVHSFPEGNRRDVFRKNPILSLTESRTTAFRRSFPFSQYGCRSRMDEADLTRVVLASRILLTERRSYLANETAWNCLELFFEKNASVLRGVPPAKLNEVMAFLADYHKFQHADLPDEFIRLYLKFLREIIKLNIMGTQLADSLTLKQQLGDDFNRILAEQPFQSAPFSGSIFDQLGRYTASDLCLDAATTLFFALAGQPGQRFTEMRTRRDDTANLFDYALKSSMDCAITEARIAGTDFTLGDVAGTAAWLGRERPDFVQAYLQLFEKLDDSGLITASRARTVARHKLVHGYYDALVDAIPRPQARPGT